MVATGSVGIGGVVENVRPVVDGMGECTLTRRKAVRHQLIEGGCEVLIGGVAVGDDGAQNGTAYELLGERRGDALRPLSCVLEHVG